MPVINKGKIKYLHNLYKYISNLTVFLMSQQALK